MKARFEILMAFALLFVPVIAQSASPDKPVQSGPIISDSALPANQVPNPSSNPPDADVRDGDQQVKAVNEFIFIGFVFKPEVNVMDECVLEYWHWDDLLSCKIICLKYYPVPTVAYSFFLLLLLYLYPCLVSKGHKYLSQISGAKIQEEPFELSMF